MKRFIAIVLVLCLMGLVAFPAFSAGLEYEPYQKTEFPKWSLDLRRAECLFFGGLPIAFPVSALALNLFNKDVSFGKTLGIACGITAVIALVDYIIGVVNEN